LTASTVHLLGSGRIEKIYGPPGTGKSTRLTEMIKSYVGEYGPDAILATSFTVTAARSLAAMGLPLPDGQVGTLHSMAYRAVGNFLDVALEPKILADWNTRAPAGWYLTSDSRRGRPDAEVAEVASGGGEGDALLAAYDLARSQLIPATEMPAAVREFAAAWDAWKTEAEAVDFSDMIIVALQRALDGEAAPGTPKILIADEAQDMTPLEIALVLAWGAHPSVARTIFALDDDQAIMNWRGGNCEPILALGTGIDGGPQLGVEVTETPLTRSWRIPAAVHSVAQTWIEMSSIRREKDYRPRDVDGQIYTVNATLNDMATARQIAKDVTAGREVMVLASCEYMLRTVITNLKELGVPFANRYRPKENRWNPLRAADGMTSAERLYRYLVADDRALGGWTEDGGRARLWTGDDVRAWSKLLSVKAAGMVRGATTVIKHLPSGTLEVSQVEGLFTLDDDELDRALGPDLEWFADAVLPSLKERLIYPLKVAREFGPAALVDPPLCTVGTIHCSPPDEPVLTTDGYVPIGQLDPQRHRLASYHQNTNTLFWNTDRSGPLKGIKKNGYPFAVARNPYVGQLITIKTDKSYTRVTPEHRVRVSFTEAFWEKWVVYLMRRGDWWRVGIAVSGHRPYRSGGLGGRLATEKADGGWVLHVCSDRQEALSMEARIQAKYGIPGLTFESSKDRSLSSSDLHEIHTSAAPFVAPRVRMLLDDYGYSESCPLYSRENVKFNRPRGWFTTEARNVLSGYMAVPTVSDDFKTGSKPVPAECVASKELFEGDVYSLEVLPYHYYVSGGVVVHNSVKGGQVGHASKDGAPAVAGVVYLSPDLSPAAAAEWRLGGRPRDSIIRQFYVGLTRTYTSCVVLGATNKYALPRATLCPPEMQVK
jgi:hypothetical protein